MTDYESLLIQEVLTQQRALATEQRAMAEDIAAIKETLAEQRGARRVVLWTAGTLGGFASLVLGAAMEYIKARLGL